MKKGVAESKTNNLKGFKSMKYEIIVNKWDMDLITLVTVFHAQHVWSDNVEFMIDTLKNKFPESEDYELTIIKIASTVETMRIK